jgi:enoyl-CoA hydratase/carnithine racemase
MDLRGGIDMSTSSARQIVLAARPKETATFERWNIVNRVAADEKLASEAAAFAERLARGATVAFAASKKIVRAYLEAGIRSADSMVDDIAPALFDSADMRDAVQAMLEYGPRGFHDKVAFRGRQE